MPVTPEPVEGEQNEPPLPSKTRGQVVRDVVIFQFKLFADGLRDVLLAPVSILLGALSLFDDRPGSAFYRLLRLGKGTERWIDLFGAAYVEEKEAQDKPAGAAPRDLQTLLGELETRVRKGGLGQDAQEGIARLRAALKKYV